MSEDGWMNGKGVDKRGKVKTKNDSIERIFDNLRIAFYRTLFLISSHTFLVDFTLVLRKCF